MIIVPMSFHFRPISTSTWYWYAVKSYLVIKISTEVPSCIDTFAHLDIGLRSIIKTMIQARKAKIHMLTVSLCSFEGFLWLCVKYCRTQYSAAADGINSRCTGHTCGNPLRQQRRWRRRHTVAALLTAWHICVYISPYARRGHIWLFKSKI